MPLMTSSIAPCGRISASTLSCAATQTIAQTMRQETAAPQDFDLATGLADPKLQARLADVGGTVLAGFACRFRHVHRRRNREMGQGDPGGQHQAGGMSS